MGVIRDGTITFVIIGGTIRFVLLVVEPLDMCY